MKDYELFTQIYNNYKVNKETFKESMLQLSILFAPYIKYNLLYEFKIFIPDTKIKEFNSILHEMYASKKESINYQEFKKDKVIHSKSIL